MPQQKYHRYKLSLWPQCSVSRPNVPWSHVPPIPVFVAQAILDTNQQVMTNDEGYHTYADFRYWQCGDFGVNRSTEVTKQKVDSDATH